jgi:hypothetical protein
VRVIVDTTALWGDWELEGGPARLVLERAFKERLEFYVPEVVVKEMVGHVRRELNEALDTQRRAAHTIEKLTRAQPAAVEVDADAAMAEYERRLRAKLRHRASVVPVPVIEHAEVIERATQRRKPFNADGAGYRDTLIWQNVLELAADGPLSFLTDNTSDFYAKKKSTLADDLRADLEQAGLDPDWVTLYRSLNDFVQDNVPKSDPELEAVKAALEDDAFAAAARAEIERAIETMPTRDFSSIPGADVLAVSSFSVESIEPTEAFERVDDELIVNIDARVQVELEVMISRSDLYEALEDGADIDWTDYDWDAAEHWATAGVTPTYRITFDCRLHSDPPKLEVVDATDVAVE